MFVFFSININNFLFFLNIVFKIFCKRNVLFSHSSDVSFNNFVALLKIMPIKFEFEFTQFV